MANVCVLSQGIVPMEVIHMDNMVEVIEDNMVEVMEDIMVEDILFIYIIMSKKYLLFYAVFAPCTNKGSLKPFFNQMTLVICK